MPDKEGYYRPSAGIFGVDCFLSDVLPCPGLFFLQESPGEPVLPGRLQRSTGKLRPMRWKSQVDQSPVDGISQVLKRIQEGPIQIKYYSAAVHFTSTPPVFMVKLFHLLQLLLCLQKHVVLFKMRRDRVRLLHRNRKVRIPLNSDSQA